MTVKKGPWVSEVENAQQYEKVCEVANKRTVEKNAAHPFKNDDAMIDYYMELREELLWDSDYY